MVYSVSKSSSQLAGTRGREVVLTFFIGEYNGTFFGKEQSGEGFVQHSTGGKRKA